MTSPIHERLLTNNGPSNVTIGTFEVAVTAFSLDMTLGPPTKMIAGAAPYIFGTDGLFGSDFAGNGSGESVYAKDIDKKTLNTPPSGAILAPGVTVRLMHSSFRVSAGISTIYTLSFDVAKLYDEHDTSISLAGSSFGTATVTVTVVPEPTATVSALSGLTSLGLLCSGICSLRYSPPNLSG
jgi:hypothetical protein